MSAPDKVTEAKAVVVGIITAMTALWGWLGWAILLMIVCMFLDYVTGSLAARRAGEWSSAIAREGLWHKLGEIFALLVAILCDIAISVILHTAAAPLLDKMGGWHDYITLMVSIWYTITELGSIIENVAAMGAPVPKWLIKGLAKLHKETDELDPFNAGEDLPDL